MKRQKPILTLTLFILPFVLLWVVVVSTAWGASSPGGGKPSSKERRITTDPANQHNPDLSGNIVVWQDNRHGNADIYFYDLATNTERNLTGYYGPAEYPGPDETPAISGNLIVWKQTHFIGGPPYGYDQIHLYDVSSGIDRVVVNGAYGRGFMLDPAISGDRIVWVEKDDSGNGDIYLYDLTTDTERRITNDSYDQRYPKVSGNLIVWQDNRHGNADIYFYDLATNTERNLTGYYGPAEYPGPDETPAVSGNFIVWTRTIFTGFGGFNNILLYDVATNSTQIIFSGGYVSNPHILQNPAISGDIVVWEGYANGNYDIYLYDLATNTYQKITNHSADQRNPAVFRKSGSKTASVSAGIVWEDYRNGNRDIYYKTYTRTLSDASK